jgi:predicted Zn-dependent protease
MRSIVARALLVVTALSLLTACETAPVTGRTRFAPIDETELNAQAAVYFRRLITRQPLVVDPATVAMVRRVGERIAFAAEHPPEGAWQAPGFSWEFATIDRPDVVNASCLPGGKITVNTGLLPITEDEAGLAVIMGHEVAHALLRHQGERLAEQRAVNAGILVGVVAGAMASPRNAQTTSRAAAMGLSLLGSVLLLSFSRTHESEADRVGMILAAHAGYDPRAALRVWQRMKSANGGRSGSPEFLSTHPDDDTRLADIEHHRPEALKFYKASP